MTLRKFERWISIVIFYGAPSVILNTCLVWEAVRFNENYSQPFYGMKTLIEEDIDAYMVIKLSSFILCIYG